MSDHRYCSSPVRVTCIVAMTVVALAGTGKVGSAQGAAIALSKTVGTDPAVCATSDTIAVVVGTPVTYCYRVENTGAITLSLHDLVDSHLGALLKGFPYTLGPGATVFLTSTTPITGTTVNLAAWVASDAITPTTLVTATDVATVTTLAPSASLALTKTVGTNPAVCATTDAITLTGGGSVTYCYMVENTGNITLTVHDLVDTHLGTLLNGFGYTLGPGASAFLTATTVVTGTTVNGAVWMASDALTATLTVTATDNATATVLPAQASIILTKTVGTDPTACASTGTITVTNQSQADVFYCYQVLNTGNITLTVHDLVDSELGVLLSGFPYALAPGASTFLTQAATLSETTVNTATWTAGLAGIASATAGGEATVNFLSFNIPALSRTGIALLLLLVAATGLVLLRRVS
jgi:hypothetical protein